MSAPEHSVPAARIPAGAEVHAAATTGYGASVDEYLRGRPSYPAAAVGAVVDAMAGRDGPAADVGAGTGAMTRLRARARLPVVAVDGVLPMLSQAGVTRRVQAAAGRLPVAPGSLAGIVVATAFHWFASPMVLADFHRGLGPGTSLVLAWNDRDEAVPWVGRYNRIVDRYAGTAPRFATMAWRAAFDRFEGFEEMAVDAYPNPWNTTRRGLVDRVLSTSFIAALPGPQKAEARAEMEQFAQEFPEQFELPYVTRMWTYRRRP